MMTIFLDRLSILRRFSVRNEMDRLLMLSVGFSSLLVVARVFFTGRLTFVSFEWNLFLAYVPYFVSRLVWNSKSLVKNNLKFGSAFLIWLLFIPNSFYIITDLFHLRESSNMPLWFDLLLILSFAWNGLVMGILSVRQMEKMVQLKYKLRNDLLFLYPIMWLNALGVYIGRYLRFNSWDVITSPFSLSIDIFDLLAHPVLNKSAFGMVFSYSLFMTLLYLSIKKMSKRI